MIEDDDEQKIEIQKRIKVINKACDQVELS